MKVISVLSLASKRLSFKSIFLVALLIVWASVTVFIFFHGVVPSFARGTINTDFAVDTTVYTHISESLKTRTDLPYALGSIFSFPNTALMPVAISLVLGTPLLIFLFNTVVFLTAVFLLNQTFSMSRRIFFISMLLNPTTTISILCLNKEIIDLLVLALFLYSLKYHRMGLRLFAFGLALLNRYEIFIVLLIFLSARNRLNPLRRHRKLTWASLVMLLSFAMPLFASSMLSNRFQEARYGGAVAVLDSLQLHYLYFLAVLPKIAEDLFGQLLNSAVWKDGTNWLYIMLFNNIANAVMVLALINKRMFTIKNDLMYLSMLGAVLMAQALAIQPRYFYFIYVLSCIQLAHCGSEPSFLASLLNRPIEKVAHA